MPTPYETVTELLDAVNVETNNLAARVQKIIDDGERTAGEGLTKEQYENSKVRLEGVVAALKGVAANPENPLPKSANTPEKPMPGPFA